MSQKYHSRIFPMWTIFLSAFISCKGGSEKNNVLQSFEITFRINPNRYCTGTSYTFTEKDIRIEADEEKSEAVGSTGNTRSNCGSKLVFQKELPGSDILKRISRLEPDNLQAIPHEDCEGGVSYAVTLKKNGQTRRIVYGGCAERFDRETERIVKFINSQVPKQYQINP